MELLVNIIFSISVHAQGYCSAICRHMLREASQPTLAPNLCLQPFPNHNVKVTPLQGKSDHVPCVLRIFQEVCIAYWVKHKHFGPAVRSSPPCPLRISVSSSATLPCHSYSSRTQLFTASHCLGTVSCFPFSTPSSSFA